MRPINVLTVIALVLVLGLAACDSQAVTTSVVPTSVSIIPTATSLAISTTAAPTVTETPTQIPTETSAAPTATACPPPTPGGPVGQIVFSAVSCAEAATNCELSEGSAANIYLINGDGTGLRQLVAGGRFPQGLSLSPDGKRLAFTDSREDLLYSPFRSHVYLWDISAGAIQPLMADLTDEETEQTPQWFPDSNRLAYVSGLVDNRGTTLGGSPTNLYTVRADGTGRTKVIERPPKSHIQSVVVSPDGSQIAFVGVEWDSSGLLEKVAAYSVNADGSNLRELMVFPLPAYFAQVFWSLDGSRIFAFDPTVNSTVLYAVQPDHVPVEHPDSTQIPGYLTGWRWASGSEVEIAICDIGLSIWTVSVSDLSVRERRSILEEQCFEIHANGWSPDGTQIAFSKHIGSPELFGLYILDVNSRRERQILEGYYVLDLLWLPADMAIP